MPCPRCRRENDGAAGSCAGCGAPLAFGDDPPARPLEFALPIDRRDAAAPGPLPWPPRRAGPPPLPRGSEAVPAEPAVAPVAAASRSHWELGPRLAADAAAALGAVAAAPARAAEPRLELDVEVGVLEVHLRRPPAWRRAAAWGIDAVPFAALGAALLRVALEGAVAGEGLGGALDLLAREAVAVLSLAAFLVLAAGVYATLGHALMGATLGKAALRLRVVARDGSRPTLRRSAARSSAALLSGALLGLGFLCALFTRSGRALHDFVAGTFVVERP